MASVTAAISRSKLAFRQMNASAAPDREGGDDHPLDQLVRVGPHQRPVLERGRLALGAVAHQVPRPRRPPPAMLAHLRPVGNPAPPRPWSPESVIA